MRRELLGGARWCRAGVRCRCARRRRKRAHAGRHAQGGRVAGGGHGARKKTQALLKRLGCLGLLFFRPHGRERKKDGVK
jgi:hypothetical protein